MTKSISAQTAGRVPGTNAQRVQWVDSAKAISIALVVMMHSTLGVENLVNQSSWMGTLVEFARPFRIPAFMAVAGLFLHRSIDGDGRKYLDNKVLHFAYFYILWVAIQCAFKAPAWIAAGMEPQAIIHQYLMTFIQPFGTLWFIYLLPVFYLATRALRNIKGAWLLIMAIALNVSPIHTGWVLIDEFASRYVFFVFGYLCSKNLFEWVSYAQRNKGVIFGLTMVWLVINAHLIFRLTPDYLSALVVTNNAGPIGKLADLPFIGLSLGLIGSMMLMAMAGLIQNTSPAKFFSYVGKNSIIIYLAFFLPMGITRILLVKFGTPLLSTGAIALLVTLSAFFIPLIIKKLVDHFGIGRFLFERPHWARFSGPTAQIKPAE